MDKRKIHISVLVGILALALVVGLTAGFLSTSVEAATSSELKAQLDAVEQAVEQSGVKLAVISQLRFMASVQRLKTAIENGQNLVVEGCYIPYNWRESFEAEYLNQSLHK